MKILVIEDDQLVADMLVEILTHQAYAVETVRDGRLGWELLTTYEYDLVILDLLIPKIDGLELCRKLRNADNHVPVLINTPDSFWGRSGQRSYPPCKVRISTKQVALMDSITDILTGLLDKVGHFANRNGNFC